MNLCHSTFFKFFCFIPFVSIICGTPISHDGELLASVVIFREGQRTPFKAFSQDPWKSEWDSLGYGQLTKFGKEQMYQLGQWLRETYADHIPLVYNKSSIYVRSVDYDESIISTYILLSGLFPTRDNQTSNLINQQLIPVHTENIYNDFLLMAPGSRKFTNLESNLVPFLNSVQTEKQWLDQKLQVQLNENVVFEDIYETLTSAEAMNLKKQPLWSDVHFKGMVEKKMMSLLLQSTETLDAAKTRIGPLINEIIQYFNNFVPCTVKDENPKYKAKLYSVTLATMVSLINGLKIADVLEIQDDIPEFGTAVIFELRDGWLGHKYVNVFLKNSTDLLKLKVKDCAIDCDFSIFKGKIEPLLRDIKRGSKKCGGNFHNRQRLLTRSYGVNIPFGL